jgi:catechol 2,3-dioxygenase-like lactoylglutathione lyase family enzyme
VAENQEGYDRLAFGSPSGGRVSDAVGGTSRRHLHWPDGGEITMLGSSNVVANLAVKDVGRSRAFFTDTLGLEEVGNKGDDMVFLRSGGCVDKIYRSDYAGTNKADAVTREVDNIDKKVEAPKAKGVTFEHYDIAGLELDGDVPVGGGVKIAWFKDPDGDILNMVEEAG